MPLSWLNAGILAWFLLGAALSAKARRGMGRGVIDYFLANRTVGGFVSAMSYSATTYSAFMMVGLVGLTYKGGIASLGFELTYLLGTVFLLVLFAPRYWLAGRRFGLMTPSELLSTRYGSKWVGAVASLLCLVTLVPYASVQLMGMGYLLEGVSGGAFPFWAGMAVAAVITVVFSIWAGLRSVALTDALQASIMLVACCILVAFIGTSFFPGGWGNAFSARPELLKVTWPFPMFLGLTLPWTFFALTNPQVVQRLYAPKDIRSIRGMVAGFSVFGFIYTVLCVLLGLSAALLVPGLE
ncbi:MAG: sodium:solute symporter family protein, partial [Synergistaceae bacterium]|nr:sodium:solute symporter family protein [Synergistaceae bacterium]